MVTEKTAPGMSAWHSEKLLVACLHDALARGDPYALDRLAEHLLPSLRRSVRAAFRVAPDDFIVDSTEDAFLEYAMCPQRFDPSRGVPLERFLQIAAKRNLQDRLRIDARRKAREQRYAAHWLLQRSSAACVPSRTLRGTAITRVLGSVCHGAEYQAALLWLQGERTTAVLSAALSLTHLEPTERRREVKRFKDRMIKRVHRHFAHTASRGVAHPRGEG
jgi:RNA polymerase sigma-70 factor, ECF subfamily